MTQLEISPKRTVFVCDKEEAHKMWDTHKDRRSDIFLESEFELIKCLDNYVLDKVLIARDKKLGTIITKELVEMICKNIKSCTA